MKFTERELYLLSDGILCLIGNARKAAELVATSAPQGVMIEMQTYRDELVMLNRKICAAMDDIEKEEQR